MVQLGHISPCVAGKLAIIEMSAAQLISFGLPEIASANIDSSFSAAWFLRYIV
jgi:hypothetical protein